MVLSHRISTLYTVILLLLLHASLEAKKPKKNLCPIGFNLVYIKGTDDALCYRLKGPENITDTFKDCSGNLYTTKLYDRLNISNYTDQILWTEYKSAYPEGPFIDTSFTSSTGFLLESSFDIANVQRQFQDELCVVKEPSGNYTAVKCNGEYYRYCIIETLSDNSVNTEGCENLNGSRRFWSPRPVCLIALSAVGGGTVRATWSQSKNLCEARGGEILYSGWRYSNYPELHTSESHVYPLRVTYDPSHSNTVRNGVEFMRQPPLIDIHNATIEVSFGALNNSKWAMVNSSYIFYNVICEKDVETKEIMLSIQVDAGNKLTLTVNYDIDEKYLYCFTDSKTYYPSRVKITSETTKSYILKPENDGNYWCISIESKRYKVSVSEKVLWIREKQSLDNTYAVKLYFGRLYSFNNVEDISEIWEKILKEYIYYSTEFSKTQVAYIEDPKIYENTLKDFKIVNPELSPKGDIIYNMRIKRLYLDRRTALVHLQLNPTMKPVRVGWWNNLRVFYMKPVRSCTVDDQKFDSGEKISKNCAVHKCVGDFINGVQVVTEIDKTCENLTNMVVQRNTQVTVSMPVVATSTEENVHMRNETYIEDSSSSEETITVTTETITESTFMSHLTITTTSPPESTIIIVPSTTLDPVLTAVPDFATTEPTDITTLPTTTTEIVELAPEEQLQQVMEDLEHLLSNTSAMLPIEVIAQPFQEVDSLLSNNVSLDIPSQLLHLLDQLGARVDVNGSEAQTVGKNLALLVADADSGSPVHGLRIVARDSNTFADDDFEIIRDRVNSSHLLSSDSEAVVQLPSSAANSGRISFVVFRNDRAFQTNNSLMAVNSKVLSIKIQNVTRFENHETVDIHFNPFVGDLGRNQSRTCAYWHFDENVSGSWSQEGCQFIAATEEGLLDTCQCTHLTHFAEILVSRELFSELDEKILEIISVTGCCLSLLGLTIIGITAILFRSWRRDFNNKIWLQLCIAITLLVICFLIAVFAKFDTYNIPCALTGIALHYSVLASFCWMLVAAILSYRRLVMVFTRDASHKLLKAAAFAWGAPFAVVGILLSVNTRAYGEHFEYKSATSTFCYPSGLSLWLSVYVPIVIMLLINWTLFVLIVRSVFVSRGIQRHGDSNEAIRCASVSCLLVFLFGLPWIFGVFSYNVVAAYFFALTATLQGLVLFIFFVVGNKKTRDLWLNKLKIKQTRKVPVTSSTYTNRSTTGVGWRGEAPANVAAKASKPRSLTSRDDSRFS